MNPLYTENLTIGYDEKTVCERLNMHAQPGKVTCLMGSNGAGKSTLLKTLAGLLPAKNGEIYIEGKNMRQYGRKELARLLSIVLTERISIRYMSALEIVGMGRSPHTGFFGTMSEHDKKLCMNCLERVHARHLALRFFDSLSDGEKQKILIARAIAQEPSILLLDEPTTHLDIKHKLEIMALLSDLAKEKNMTILCSLHEPDLAIKACHMAIAIKNGVIVYDGPPENMERQYPVRDLYDMNSDAFSHVTGSVEMQAGQSDRLFVTAGGGMAIPMFRVLAKNRIGFTAGVLGHNETEYVIASAMGARLFASDRTGDFDDDSMTKAFELVKNARAVVDTAFPLENGTRYTQKLLAHALENRVPCYSFRDKDTFADRFGSHAKDCEVRFISNMIDCDWNILS